jgi:uncharacterized damage-inducible protein DinB
MASTTTKRRIEFCARFHPDRRFQSEEDLMLKHFRMFADYNRWANNRLYAAARTLSDAEYHENKGAFFGSLHSTLNHLLVADRVWMHRFTGEGDKLSSLDAVLFDDLKGLSAARQAQDRQMVDWIDGLDEASLTRTVTYTALSAQIEISQPLGPLLSHVFNHQTHHRGQCHMTLTALGKPSLVLDLVYFLRDDGQHWL